MEDPAATTIDVDYHRQWRFCIEAKFKGSDDLERNTCDNYQTFTKWMAWYAEQEIIEWVKGYRIEILTQWNEWT